MPVADDAVVDWIVRGDADFADAHYNLALLCEKLGRGQEAIRHISRYRKLTR